MELHETESLEVEQPGQRTIETPEKHISPVGTLEELAEAHLSPVAFGSCSEPVERKNLGCPSWHLCTMSYKGLAGKRPWKAEQIESFKKADIAHAEQAVAGGPHNHGVRIVKHRNNGAGVREVTKPCYVIVHQHENLKQQRTIQRIVANEGGTITIRGSWPEAKPANPLKPKMKDEIRKMTVPPFPRPNDNADLFRIQYANQVFLDEEMREEEVQEALTLGKPVKERLDVRDLYDRTTKADRKDDGDGKGGAEGGEAPADVGRGKKGLAPGDEAAP